MRKKAFTVGLSIILLFTLISNLLPSVAFAVDNGTDVAGKVYEFDKNAHYEFSSSSEGSPSSTMNTYGSFSVSGNVLETSTKNGVSALRIDDGKMSIMYSYTDLMLNAGEDEWHLVDDKSKKVDTITMESNILKGAIIVQTSVDRNNWITVGTGVNVFADNPVNTSAIYEAQDIQLINGCYYRVIVAYELAMRTQQSGILFIDTSKYEYKKIAEVYEFYAYSSESNKNDVDPQQTYNIGKVVRTDKFEGYAGEKEIVAGDPHYGITLGQFYVSGYTDTAKDINGNMVFLKNVGDKVVLWFSLKENIDAIGGNEDIKVTPDNSGSDQYFQTETTDFGRGTLIVRYTDYNNNVGEPQIYTNYLEANVSVGADTRVSLFEEGDYEVALDYELTEDKLIDSEAHYRIFFKFSIRNGNCMVYPFDVATGEELTNSSMTENGFRLDLAKSRYLKVIVKREVMAESADGLVEDTRFNGPAKDGAEYTTDGIYTITVTNQYTNQLTVKKIYVGTNPVLRAFMTTGLSIPEINNLVAEGAVINEDGTIQLATVTTTEPEVKPTDDTPIVKPIETEPEDTSVPEEAESNRNLPLYGGIGVVAVAVIAIIAIAVVVKKKKKKTNHNVMNEDEGGNNQ